MIYDRSARTVACASKKNNGNLKNTPGGVTVSPALDWLAALVTHIPDKGHQLVRFYGRYSNVCQGLKKRAAAAPVQNDDEQAQGEGDSFHKQCRSQWARLIKKIYETDPLVCPKCQGPMTIISFLDDPAVVKRILVHLKLWEVSERSPPPASTPVISSTIRISSVGLSTDSCSPPSRRALRSLRNRKNWAKPAFLHPITAGFTSSLRSLL
jgi:hypothetical protein